MFELATYLGISWVYYILASLYALTIVAIVIVIISENRNPVKSLAWVTVLLLLPFVGIVLYIFFGRSIKNKRMISRRNRRRLKKRELRHPRDRRPEGLSPESQQSIRLGRSLTGAPFHPGNDVDIFTSGAEKIAALKDDLRRARRSICIQYYIFCDDRVGREVRDILIGRARAGVDVRLIYDHVGCWGTPSRFFREMQQAGIKAYPFFKVTFPQLGTKINWRNHRKICIIDGAVGYIGGMNIADRYIDGGKNFDLWRDTHARVRGPIVASLLHSFAVDWNFMGQPLIDDIADPMALYGKGDVGMQMLTSGPSHRHCQEAHLHTDALFPAHRQPAEDATGRRAVACRRARDDTPAQRFPHAHLRLRELHLRVSPLRNQVLPVSAGHDAQQDHTRRRRLRKHGFPQLRAQLRGQPVHIFPQGKRAHGRDIPRRHPQLPPHSARRVALASAVAQGHAVAAAPPQPHTLTQ